MKEPCNGIDCSTVNHYYRGLKEWGHMNGFLTDTCLTTQDYYKKLLDYFKIKCG